VKSFQTWLITSLIGYLILMLILGCILDYSLQQFIILVVGVFPFIRHNLFSLQSLCQDKKWFERIGERTHILDGQKTNFNPEQMKAECEKIQYQLFCHRGSGFLIPDWFYRFKKPLLDKENRIH
ncbi:MAG TPA: S-4TM family putative pore-forming effector, partial [Bacillota bacterium]|nr:S-4TM family putative pore-forming effector [Bacillota bacterium]